MVFLVCIGLVLTTAVSAQQTAPIPLLAVDPGYRLDEASAGAPVRLEAFIELVCPDSLYSWPILKELQDFYGPEKLEVVFHHLVLPYHRQAMLTAQGFYYVLDEAPEAAIDYMDIVFENYAQLTNGNTRDLSENEVAALLGDIQEPATGIASGQFAQAQYGYSGSAVRTWKYATRRGMAGTPWFVVNNVDLAVNPSIRLSFDDWRAILDPLVPAKK